MREVDNNDRFVNRESSSSDCDICANEGVVPTRHPELDGTEAWLDDYCDCRYGRRREDADLDEQGIGEEYF